MLFILSHNMAQICFITAIYGPYELSTKLFAKQTVSTDFICFTDNPDITNPSGWIIDTTPYHFINKSNVSDDCYNNAFCNNQHKFNLTKYYKQAFNNIPRLEKYDVVVWLDGTIEITYEKTSEYILKHIGANKIIGWGHSGQNSLIDEVVGSSNLLKYARAIWNCEYQPHQDITAQYEYYLSDGFSEQFFAQMPQKKQNRHFGVWITCFVAFLKNDPEVKRFLDLWYLQTLKYTTQDQVGFPYVIYKTGLIPHTLPDTEIYGIDTCRKTMFYIKHSHEYESVVDTDKCPLRKILEMNKIDAHGQT